MRCYGHAPPRRTTSVLSHSPSLREIISRYVPPPVVPRCAAALRSVPYHLSMRRAAPVFYCHALGGVRRTCICDSASSPPRCPPRFPLTRAQPWRFQIRWRATTPAQATETDAPIAPTRRLLARANRMHQPIPYIFLDFLDQLFATCRTSECFFCKADLQRLRMPEQWCENVQPLRKSCVAGVDEPMANICHPNVYAGS